MIKTKIIANYLPQYHSIPENDKWWGKGYTDWEAVKKSKQLFDGHSQPRVPLNAQYYDLSKKQEIEKQVRMAKEYGVWGFGIYHYWFNSELMLLEKPSEILLNNKDIDINFMFIWDNGTWKRTWSNVRRGNDWAPVFDNQNKDKSQSSPDDNGVLAELKYGDESDWKTHFNYLLPFFKDNRYIRIDNKPVFVFYQPDNDNETVCKMCKYWNELAVKNGLNGIAFVSKTNYKGSAMEYTFDYEPLSPITNYEIFKRRAINVMNRIHPRLLKYNYDALWKKILSKAKKCDNEKHFYGAFVDYDDTPRRGKKGKVVLGASPEKFKNYMTQLINISQKQGKKYIFLTAWNEWGEGAYLEPDQENGYAYLEALKEAVDNVNGGM